MLLGVHIDPPFNSKRNYFQIYNNVGGEDRAQAKAFEDTWEWGNEAVGGLAYITDVLHLQSGKLTNQTVELIRGRGRVLGEGSLLAYLVLMTLRIVEIHRVLKSTGSFYLHCDPTASHYLKIDCDSVFCGDGGDFRNEIVWLRTNSHNMPSKEFAKQNGIILFPRLAVENLRLIVDKSAPQERWAGGLEPRHSNWRNGLAVENVRFSALYKRPVVSVLKRLSWASPYGRYWGSVLTDNPRKHERQTHRPFQDCASRIQTLPQP